MGWDIYMNGIEGMGIGDGAHNHSYIYVQQAPGVNVGSLKCSGNHSVMSCLGINRLAAEVLMEVVEIWSTQCVLVHRET